MSKFLVLYRAPVAVLDEWMSMPEETRKSDEAKMRDEWNQWMEKNASHILETAGAGKTKRVSGSGVEDARNDVMLYAMVEAESHDAAAQMFTGHPHLQIPESSIEVMAANPLSM